MQTVINRRNFRQEYNLLLIESEEIRSQNRYLKAEVMKLMNLVKKSTTGQKLYNSSHCANVMEYSFKP